MGKPIYISDDSAHSRRIIVRPTSEPCRFCKEEGDAVEVDTSDDEYLSFVCCARCFVMLCKGIIPA